jgi:L-lactate dehydrogenase complex protein LldG
MKDDRELIFGRIRAAIAERGKRTPRPAGDPQALVVGKRLAGADPWEAFARNFTAVRGYYCDRIEHLAAFLAEKGVRRGYCDPALREAVGEALAGRFDIVYQYSRDAIDEIEFAVTRAKAVIAETGTIVLSDRTTSNRLAAVAPWVHVAAVSPEAIHPSLGEAIDDLGDDPNTIFVTGPSKTADVEGILIEGVHGPGEQVCLRL